jgi:lipopolysaccharide biosynthesis glycosyltransferase
MSMIRVFIGFDENEEVAFHVLSQSIHKYATVPVSITPIRLSQLKNIFTRDINPLQSTQFSFSRFLVPYLSEYDGFSIFLDCDMLFLDDIAKLWEHRDDKYALQVVKHNHIPKNDIKFLNNPQSKYKRKNWSSVMIFNNEKCKALTLDYVNSASGLELHQFKWLKDEQIGSLSQKYNFLVSYSEDRDDIVNLHYTEGGAYFREYENTPYSDEWKNALKELLYAKDTSSFLQKAIDDIR